MGLLLYAILYTLINRSARKYYVPVKMLASTAYIVIAACLAVKSDNLAHFWILLPAFALCWAGDLFLGLHKKIVKTIILLIGTSCFMGAHLFFLIFLYGRTPFTGWDLIAPAASAVIVWFLGKSEKYDFGRFRYGAVTYAFCIGYLFGKSLVTYIADPVNSNFFFMVGALFFIISDFLILVLYFRKKRAWTVHGWNLATYYLAMYFISISIYFV